MKTKFLKQSTGKPSFSRFFESTTLCRSLGLFVVLLPLLCCITSCRQDVTLSSGKYVIVIPEAATEIEQKAAAEFKRLLALTHPVKMDIVKDNHQPQKLEIVIGATNRALPNETGDLQRDGFTIQTQNGKLFVRGGFARERSMAFTRSSRPISATVVMRPMC